MSRLGGEVPTEDGLDTLADRTLADIKERMGRSQTVTGEEAERLVPRRVVVDHGAPDADAMQYAWNQIRSAEVKDTGDTARPDDNPKSAYGIKKPPLHLCPPSAHIEWSTAMGLGAKKYGAYNWRDNSVAASVYVSAAKRHLDAWLDGEDIDPDSGGSHLGNVMACAAILIDAISIGNLIDDRPVKGMAGELQRAYANRVQPKKTYQEVAEELIRKPEEKANKPIATPMFKVGDRVRDIATRILREPREGQIYELDPRSSEYVRVRWDYHAYYGGGSDRVRIISLEKIEEPKFKKGDRVREKVNAFPSREGKVFEAPWGVFMGVRWGGRKYRGTEYDRVAVAIVEKIEEPEFKNGDRVEWTNPKSGERFKGEIIASGSNLNGEYAVRFDACTYKPMHCDKAHPRDLKKIEEPEFEVGDRVEWTGPCSNKKRQGTVHIPRIATNPSYVGVRLDDVEYAKGDYSHLNSNSTRKI